MAQSPLRPTMLFWQILCRLIVLVRKACLWPVVAGAVVSLVSGVGYPLILWIDKQIIDTLVAALHSDERSRLFYTIALLVAAQATIHVVLSITDWVGKFLLTKAGLMLREHVVTALMAKTVRFQLARFDSPSYYNQLEKARREASERPLDMVATLIYAFRTTVETCGNVMILCRFSWLAVFVIVASCAPGYIHQLGFARKNWQLATDKTPEWRAMTYLTKLLTGKEAAQEVRLFGIANHLMSKHQSIFIQLIKDTRAIMLRNNKTGMLLAFIHSVGVVGVFAAAFTAALLGKITLGAMMMYRNAAQGLYNNVQWYTISLGSLLEDAYHLSDLFMFLDEDEGEVQYSGTDAQGLTNYELRLENVSFRYPGTDRDVLRNVSFTVSPGERVALVGKNGAGKSTLVKLITGLYQPTQGRILIGDVDANTLSTEERATLFAACLQDFCSYAFSAAEGIALGDTRSLDDMSRISHAAKQAGADEFLQLLPASYETCLGREFDETGVPLSGGQQQKMALSRAFVRDEKVSRILILDEPTASLDPQAEQEIYSRFAELVEGRSAIMITHRLGSVTMTDKVVYLEDGTVVEQGAHAELLGRRGKYSELFLLQAANYQAG